MCSKECVQTKDIKNNISLGRRLLDRAAVRTLPQRAVIFARLRLGGGDRGGNKLIISTWKEK